MREILLSNWRNVASVFVRASVKFFFELRHCRFFIYLVCQTAAPLFFWRVHQSDAQLHFIGCCHIAALPCVYFSGAQNQSMRLRSWARGCLQGSLLFVFVL